MISAIIDITMVFGAVACAILVVYTLIANWFDARKARQLNADWEAYKTRQRVYEAEVKKALAEPIEWSRDVDHLDTAHLVVKHESGDLAK